MKVLRFDSPMGGLGKPRKMRGGGIRVDSRFTKPGVFGYEENGQTVMEYRPSSEVFDAKSVESWKGVPITDGHPGDLVTSETWRQHAIGILGDNVRQLEGALATTETIHDPAKVAMVLDGRRPERSGGYWAELDATPGITQGDPHVPDGLRYDRVQRQIEGNHVAILPLGHARLGPDMTMRLDSKGNQSVRVLRTDDGDKPMKKLPFLGKTYDLEDASDVARLEVAIEADASERKARTDAAEGLVKERDELKGRCDALDAEAKKLPEKIAAGVAARVALETRGRAVLGEEFDSKLDDKAMASAIRAGMEAAIRADDAAATLEGESDDYVRGRFERLHVDAAKVDESHAAFRSAIKTAQSTAPVDVGALYRASREADTMTQPSGRVAK